LLLENIERVARIVVFSWLRRQFGSESSRSFVPAPNPGRAVEARIQLLRGGQSWTEEVNVLEAAARALTQHDHAVFTRDSEIVHQDSGLVFRPLLAEFVPLDSGGVRTVTTMQTSHPDLVPEGIFEFQHGAGKTTEEALANGFDSWVQGDLVAFLEALREQPVRSMTLVMEFPAKDDHPALRRRAVLGPVAHFMESGQHQAGAGAQACPPQGEHPFCPCCLLTSTFPAFKAFIQQDGLYGIRFYAARDQHGRPQADCRINGTNWPAGAVALRKYVKKWPPNGFEFRKQYVLFQTLQPRPEA
jgi:hypothetical protein